MGAHPAAPSRLDDGRRLDEVISAAPERLLGREVAVRFGPRLPFLMKLLAAAEPLSLQVHPTSERARIGCAAQDAAGIPLSAPERSYPDASHKPELIYALTRFEGMAGFRDPVKTAAILRRLRLPWLQAVADRLDATSTPFQTLRAVVTDMLATSGPALSGRLQELQQAATLAAAEVHHPDPRRRPPHVDPHDVSRESRRVYEAVAALVDRYPADPGVLVTLLLNHVVLAAGEAMYVDAGIIHAYTSGFGVEIMASSDNVVRAGLTPKHVDIPELLEITNFTPVPPPLWAPLPRDRMGTLAFSPPVDEFELVIHQATPDGAPLDRTGPRIAVALDAPVVLRTEAAEHDLPRGEAVFIAADDPPVAAHGQGRVALGRVPV